jgi:hypothetical protein
MRNEVVDSKFKTFEQINSWMDSKSSAKTGADALVVCRISSSIGMAKNTKKRQAIKPGPINTTPVKDHMQ